MKVPGAVAVLAVLMVASFSPFALLLSPVEGLDINKFSGGWDSETIVFGPGGDVNSSLSLGVPNNTKVLAATMNLTTGPYTFDGRDYPGTLSIDVGGDGTEEWGWGGAGIGALGWQNTFSSGATSATFDFAGAGSNLTANITLPSNAIVDSATLDINGSKTVNIAQRSYNGQAGEYLGISVAPVGDYNGDGYMDFVAGGTRAPVAISTMYLFFGNGTTGAEKAGVFTAEEAYDLYGYSCDGAGDVNGDGYDDIIVGAYSGSNGSMSEAGAAYLYLGGTTVDTTPHRRFYGGQPDDHFGNSVAGIGDVNKDGYDDVLVGAPGNDTNGDDAGAAYVFFGGNPMNNASDLTVNGDAPGDELGYSVAAAGDVNNDTSPDFIVGAWYESSVSYGGGAVYVHLGGPGLDNQSDVSIKPSGSDYFGEFVAGLGDVNGDGYDDIGVWNYQYQVWVYYGGSSMNTGRDRLFGAESYNDYYGVGFDGLGDLNKDGYDDIIIGAFLWDDGDETGKAYVYFGGPDMDVVPDLTYIGESVGDRLGVSVASAGDVNKDGFQDFIIGAYYNDAGGIGSGKVYLELYSEGVKDTRVSLEETGAVIWQRTGLFTGLVGDIPIKDLLNSALLSEKPDFVNGHGNAFTVLTLNVSIKNRGNISISGIDIVYRLNITLPDFASEVNDAIKNMTPAASGNYEVPVKVSSSSAGKVTLSGLRLTVDEAPKGLTPMPVLHIAEGTKNASLADLWDLFQDDLDADQGLFFDLQGYTNKSSIKVTIREDRYLSVDALTGSPDVNWTGISIVKVTATDTKGLRSLPLSITLDVFNTEDAPVILPAPSSALSAMEGSQYTYQIVANDGDAGDLLSYTLSQGPTGMTVDILSGVVNWVPGLQDVGSVHVSFMVDDGEMNVTQDINITASLRVTAGNRLPIVTSTPPLMATIGQVYTYRVEAEDADKDILTFSLDEAPQGMTIDDQTGRIRWLPGAGVSTLTKVNVNISDGKDRVFQEFSIEVLPGEPNSAPEFVGSPPTSAYVGLMFTYQFVAYDMNPLDTVTFSLQYGPQGLYLSEKGLLTWTPTEQQMGTETIIIRLSDGKVDIVGAFNITILMNHPPVIGSTPMANGTVGTEYNYKMDISDPDVGDTISIELIEAPESMIIDPITHEILWTPESRNIGTNVVSIKVTDGREVTYQNFTISIVAAEEDTDGGNDQLNQSSMLIPLVLVAFIIVAMILAVVVFQSRGGRGAPSTAVNSKMVGETSGLIIEDVFLIYRDGRLMSHHTRRLKPEADAEIITSMLTAIQDFVRQSIPTEGMEQRAVHEITFGNDKILLQHGKNVYIAAVVGGETVGDFPERMKASIEEIESIYGHMLADWDGDISRLKGAKLLMRELLKEGGKGAPVEEKAVRAKGKGKGGKPQKGMKVAPSRDKPKARRLDKGSRRGKSRV